MLLSTLSAIVGEVEHSINNKGFVQVLVAAAIALHGRNQEMSLVQYMIGLILTHGGCTQLVCLDKFSIFQSFLDHLGHCNWFSSVNIYLFFVGY